MELYEYKLAAMGHAERAAMASVEAASQRCVHLQHHTAQLTAELSRLHQLLFHTQQSHEEAVKQLNNFTENNKELENRWRSDWTLDKIGCYVICFRLNIERGKLKACSSQLKIKEAQLAETQQMLDETNKKFKDAWTAKQSLEEQNAEFKAIISKLEENLMKKERLLERKEEAITKANASIESLKMVSHLSRFETVYSIKIFTAKRRLEKTVNAFRRQAPYDK